MRWQRIPSTIFARLLGRFAGDLALTFESSGGVFIAGGIAPRMVDILQAGGFRDAFDRKAPHDAWARKVPAYVIVNPEPALQGLAAIVTNPQRFRLPIARVAGYLTGLAAARRLPCRNPHRLRS